MTTLIFTYRNRDIALVKNCLESLRCQSSQAFKVVLVNYGSNTELTQGIQELVAQYDFIAVIHCKTDGELWCKSRAINIALKQCDTDTVFVGDVDMIFHPDFIERLGHFKKEHVATYFQVGFLSQTESAQQKPFEAYTINFTSNKDATGMTLFNTQDLLEINGYDEYYKGWGSEDTDVHIRLRHAGKTVNFYDDAVLMLHQWHPKHYRTQASLEPFHSQLEVINAAYLKFTEQTHKIKANVMNDFGRYKASDYEALNQPDTEFKITNQTRQIKGWINSMLMGPQARVLKLIVTQDPDYRSIKQGLKKLLRKKTMAYLSMQAINDLLLETVAIQQNVQAYHYQFDQARQIITLTVKL